MSREAKAEIETHAVVQVIPRDLGQLRAAPKHFDKIEDVLVWVVHDGIERKSKLFEKIAFYR